MDSKKPIRAAKRARGVKLTTLTWVTTVTLLRMLEVNASHMNLAFVGKFSSHPPTTLKFGNQGSESWKAGGLRPTIDGVMGSKPLGIDEVAKSQLVALAGHYRSRSPAASYGQPFHGQKAA